MNAENAAALAAQPDIDGLLVGGASLNAESFAAICRAGRFREGPVNESSSRRHLVALVGATASGKTAAAVAIARRLPVEVISADSRQIRAEMRIGTAAPTDEELAAVPHHLVGIVAPDAPWSLADFLARGPRCPR